MTPLPEMTVKEVSVNVGSFVYSRELSRWTVAAGGVELQELHCGDVLQVRDITDDTVEWRSARMECHGADWWYLITDRGPELCEDDFPRLEVLLHA